MKGLLIIGGICIVIYLLIAGLLIVANYRRHKNKTKAKAPK